MLLIAINSKVKMKTLRLYCDVEGCRKAFRNQEGLDSHKENGHRPLDLGSNTDFKCNLCNKSLSTKQSLKEHLYTHSGEKPYKCLEAGCGVLFRQSSQLSNHKKVHLEIKKNTPELTKVNLVILSRLFLKIEKTEYSIPTGPYTLNDAKLPELCPRPMVVLRTVREIVENS